MSSLVIKTFHTIGFAIYAYAIYYSELHLDIPQKSSRKIFGRYKYLTHWNLVLQGFMFTLCCFIDFAPIRDKRTLLKWRDHLFLSLSLPTCIFVATLFWSLYFYNRELIFPVVLERFYPGWLNHTSHTVILVFALLEVKLCYHVQPRRREGFMTLLFFICAYNVWLVYLGVQHDIYVYPVMEALPPTLLPVFISFCSVIMFGLYVVAEEINRFCWPNFRGRAVQGSE